jgi:hypothetical protein
MPKIDENKVADLLNTLLTDNILKGENLIQQMNQSTTIFNKNVDVLTNTLTERTSEVQELIKVLKSAPKLGKTIKISAILASFAAGAALASLLFVYSISSISIRYVRTNNEYIELITQYNELSEQADTLNKRLRAHIKVYDRLDAKSREALVNILVEETNKIEKEPK